jgi:two-component system CheB/CheR fusion protein
MLSERKESVMEYPLAPGSAAADAWPAGRPARVLIIEDNRDTADTLRMLLELSGHEVRVAYSGPEGVRAALEWPPDAVLCDIGLPGLDGWAVARALRRDPRTAQTRLIAVSGYGTVEDRRRSRESGFEYHLEKPADPDVLEQLLTGGR